MFLRSVWTWCKRELLVGDVAIVFTKLHVSPVPPCISDAWLRNWAAINPEVKDSKYKSWMVQHPHSGWQSRGKYLMTTNCHSISAFPWNSFFFVMWIFFNEFYVQVWSAIMMRTILTKSMSSPHANGFGRKTWEALKCYKKKSWIFWNVLLRNSVWFRKTEVCNTRMEMKVCKVCPSSILRCFA